MRYACGQRRAPPQHDAHDRVHDADRDGEVPEERRVRVEGQERDGEDENDDAGDEVAQRAPAGAGVCTGDAVPAGGCGGAARLRSRAAGTCGEQVGGPGDARGFRGFAGVQRADERDGVRVEDPAVERLGALLVVRGQAGLLLHHGHDVGDLSVEPLRVRLLPVRVGHGRLAGEERHLHAGGHVGELGCSGVYGALRALAEDLRDPPLDPGPDCELLGAQRRVLLPLRGLEGVVPALARPTAHESDVVAHAAMMPSSGRRRGGNGPPGLVEVLRAHQWCSYFGGHFLWCVTLKSPCCLWPL